MLHHSEYLQNIQYKETWSLLSAHWIREVYDSIERWLCSEIWKDFNQFCTRRIQVEIICPPLGPALKADNNASSKNCRTIHAIPMFRMITSTLDVIWSRHAWCFWTHRNKWAEDASRASLFTRWRLCERGKRGHLATVWPRLMLIVIIYGKWLILRNILIRDKLLCYERGDVIAILFKSHNRIIAGPKHILRIWWYAKLSLCTPRLILSLVN